MAKIIHWTPKGKNYDMLLFSLKNKEYPGVTDIHWHEGDGGNIHVKMVFKGIGNYVHGDIDEQTPVEKFEELLDWMYRKGQQEKFV